MRTRVRARAEAWRRPSGRGAGRRGAATRGKARRRAAAWPLLALLLAPAAGAAQEGPPVEIGGLLRVGFHAEPEETGRNDGFDVFDAHLSVGGEIGLVFEYFVRGEFDTEDNVLRLLDARLDLPVIPEVSPGFGLFRPAFGLEALEDEGDFTFLRRSQASEAIAPGRQIGAELFGEALEGRLTYAAGMFNGNGPTFENDDDRFLYAARAQYNTVGPIEFYEDLVVQVGASIAYSKDAAATLGPGLVDLDLVGAQPLADLDPERFAGERLLFGADIYASYRGFSLRAEYLRGDFEPEDDEIGPDSDSVDSYGGYVEGSYRLWGAIEGVVRYDGFSPAVGENRDFIVAGINVFPGYYAKLGLQYAFKLHDSSPSPTLAGNQFVLLLQVDF